MASAGHTETHADMSSALDYAREQGRLSGEVRVLKWAVGAAFVTIIATLGAIYTEMNQGFREVNQRLLDVNRQFQDVNRRIDQLTHSVADVRERLTHIEGRFDRSEAANPTTDRHS